MKSNDSRRHVSLNATVERNDPSGRRSGAKRLYAAGTLFVLLGIYFAVIWLNFTESARRSVSLTIPSHSDDYLFMHVDVVNVDVQHLEMTARIMFSVSGTLAKDEVTPATDLQLVLNTVRGQQEITFPKGERMNIMEAVFPLQGEINRYPLDHYTGNIWLLATIPERQRASARAPRPKPKAVERIKPTANTEPPEQKRGLRKIFSRGKQQTQVQSPATPVESVLSAATIEFGATALTAQVQADTKINFTASVPGLTFRGTQPIEGVQSLKGLTGIQLHVKRSLAVITISAIATLMMLGLSIGVVTMTLRVLSGSRQMAAFHASMAVSLIFGLPALRSIQPGIPSPGTLGDMLAFTWAEIAAAGSVIALVIQWLLKRPMDVGRGKTQPISASSHTAAGAGEHAAEDE